MNNSEASASKKQSEVYSVIAVLEHVISEYSDLINSYGVPDSKEQGWQPIETVIVGEPVLLLVGGYVLHGVFVLSAGEWECATCEECFEGMSPTHWMPLPPPPKEKQP